MTRPFCTFGEIRPFFKFSALSESLLGAAAFVAHPVLEAPRRDVVDAEESGIGFPWDLKLVEAFTSLEFS